MSVKIVSLELENVKRVRAVHLGPEQVGLTVIGGDNRQGKTSILDGIAYALGGEKYRPTNLQHEGGQAEARMEVVLSNGLRVERKGKNANLKVTDSTGTKQGQKLLDAFLEELAINMPKFLQASDKEKALTLLRILGIEEQLAALEREERAAYDERTTQGRIAASKKAHAEQLPEHHGVPDEPLSPGDLVRASQDIMARNAERANARRSVERLRDDWQAKMRRHKDAESRVQELARMLADAKAAAGAAFLEVGGAKQAYEAAAATQVAPDESTAEVETKLAELETINAKVRANLDKRKAMEDADHAAAEYNRLTAKVEDVRARRMALLKGADLPLPGLGVADGALTYDGKAWDCMSGVERIRVAVAIVRRLKPECGFVLLDGLETFDRTELAGLHAWLTEQGLQAIATRVSRGDECSIIIEDGMVVEVNAAVTFAETAATELEDIKLEDINF